ncbi:hypothetical protein EX895_005375 [Sporisorium graminicola]|uniref:Uncharacterized protein n=1 Tax=Sporisorium graminicola TaxID=280036 RepID=A0A4U7KNJ0_9BASI|nr:hypothetical protein EX895_005375 [Sporisorium graminicola]TKY85834.1 hypothetical protein EX895_005375 [Sporisorium graminicola]
MDANPDFDYEMEPQAAYVTLHSSAEEAMDELSSEGAPMSDIGVRFEPADKVAIDVDFYDPAAVSKTDADLPILTASATHVESEEAIDAPEALLEDHSHTGVSPQYLYDAVTEDVPEAATEAGSHAARVGAGPYQVPDEDDHHLDSVEQAAAPPIDEQGYDGEEEEHDELQQEDDASAVKNGAVLTAPSAESDQLREDGHDSVQPSAEEGEGAQGVNGHAYHHSEEEADIAIRVTFHGQDFVMWSAEDIPAFLAVAHAVEKTVADDNADEVVQIEAPALEVAKDVLWQPLDSLFAGLRDKMALGDFLDESHELNIAFPDLDLDVAEDNLYCRELTLDDLLQLHHGLGLETSLHILVSERPRFITKYNELAQHVAGLLSHQLQHSSDEEEEAANAGHSLRNTEALVETVYESEGLPAAGEELGEETAIALPNLAAQAGTASDVEQSTSAALQGALPHSEEQARQPSKVDNTETTVTNEDSDAHQTSEQHELGTQQHPGTLEEEEAEEVEEEEEEEEERVDELAGELQDEQEEEQGRGGEEGNAAQATVSEAEYEVAITEGAGDARQAGQQESVRAGAGDEDEDAQEAAEEEDEGVESLEGDKKVYEAEYADQEDEEYEEYADGIGENGDDAEQTFYTTVNDSSGAEEDELEEPQQGEAQGSSFDQPPNDPESTSAYEAGDDEQDWQDQVEEQIVEYTEEHAETALAAGTPSSTSSTSYNTAAQRKRGLDEQDDDEALYEQDDYEAESKRVKVD